MNNSKNKYVYWTYKYSDEKMDELMNDNCSLMYAHKESCTFSAKNAKKFWDEDNKGNNKKIKLNMVKVTVEVMEEVK